MTKKKAIRIVAAQKAKMNAPGFHFDELYKNDTLSCLDSIFGKNSIQYEYIAKVQPFKYVGDPIAWAWDRGDIEKFFDGCIQVIYDRPINKEKNFLNTISNEWIIAISVPLISGLLGIGYMWGVYTSDVKNYKLENRIEKQHDSLTFLLNHNTNTYPNKHTDDANKAKKK